MKRSIIVSMLLGSLLIFNCVSYPAAAKAAYYTDDGRPSPVSDQQLKAQIQYFKQALDKLSPSSPEQAAKLWAEGQKTRNGVLQYAAACDELKAKIIKNLGKADENLWNIGVSSPWVEKYEIKSAKKLDPAEYHITIKYYWATSSGPAGTSEEALTILPKGLDWCVQQVNVHSKS